jgi:hypothetical protein
MTARASATPYLRRDLGFMELQRPTVIDGQTVFVIERASVRKMLPFWYHIYVKAALRDLFLGWRNRWRNR